MAASFMPRAASIGRVALLMLAAASLQGQTVSRSPDSGDHPGEFVTFVGHYGEVLKLSGDWNLDASMHGEAEVINHYPKIRFISEDLFEPFKPKPEDFVPENFSRDRLVQLIVLPWSASSSKSLEELKRLKIKDLESSKVEFRIVDDPWTGSGNMGQKWPKGSFEVFIATPYRLAQLYTTSRAHLVILTAGRDTASSYAIGRHADQMRMSLRDWIMPETGYEIPPTHGPVPAPNVSETGVSLHVLTKPKVWMTWAFVNGLALLLLSVLGAAKRRPLLHGASLSLLVFSNAGALIGGLVGLCFWPFGWFSAHATVPSAVTCLFMPLLAWSIGRARTRRPRRSAMVATAACGLASSAFFTYVSLGLDTGTGNSPHLAAYTALFVFPFFAVTGILFGLLDSTLPKPVNGRALLTLTLLLSTGSALRAQSGVVLIEKGTPNPIGPMEGDAVARAKKRLAEKHLDFAAFKSVAEAKLKEAGKLYKYQRVEIKGILAKDACSSEPGFQLLISRRDARPGRILQGHDQRRSYPL